MGQLYVGFSRVNITPMMGIGMRRSYRTLFIDEVLDDIEIATLAVSCGDTKALLFSLDLGAIGRNIIKVFKQHISKVTGLPFECIYISATHNHTCPQFEKDSDEPLQQEYYRFVYRKIGDAAQFALADLKPAKVGYGIGKAPNIAFIRRYRMKDGTVWTNPGVRNPDIVAPIGEIDERVNVLRFDRDVGDSIVLVNFGNHADVVGGCKISADWPGFLRKEVERNLPGTKCIFFNGAEGDVNHINVHHKRVDSEYMSDTAAWRGYGHAKYMGRAMAGCVLQVFDKVKCISVDSIRCKQKTITVPANISDPEEIPEARRIYDLYMAGRADELPYPAGMRRNTVLAKSKRIVVMENGPESFEMELSAIAIGNVVFIGIPGEPFTGIGVGLKEAEGWDLIMPTCQTNGSEGYFPMREAYDEGGYEAVSNRYQAGVAELIIEEGKKLMAEIAE